MAATARNLAYQGHQRAGYTDGSLARDLDWAVREHELRHAGKAPSHQERQQVQQKPKIRSISRANAREPQRVSLFTVMGFLAVGAMAVLMLLCSIRLTVLASDAVDLKKQLEVLQTESATLTAEYEQMFDLDTVREAAEAAGMRKPSVSQICYLKITDGDNAVIYQRNNPSVLTDVMTSLNHSVYAMMEYFG
jgi:hypothetical protein